MRGTLGSRGFIAWLSRRIEMGEVLLGRLEGLQGSIGLGQVQVLPFPALKVVGDMGTDSME